MPEQLRSKDDCLDCYVVLNTCKTSKCMENDPDRDFAGLMWKKLRCHEEFPNDTCSSCGLEGAPPGGEGDDGEQEPQTSTVDEEQRTLEAEDGNGAEDGPVTDGTADNGTENGTTGTENGTLINGTEDDIASDRNTIAFDSGTLGEDGLQVCTVSFT